MPKYFTKDEYIRFAIDWIEEKIRWHADRENFPAHLITNYQTLLDLAYDGKEKNLKEALKYYFAQPFYKMDHQGDFPTGPNQFTNLTVLISAIEVHFNTTRKPQSNETF